MIIRLIAVGNKMPHWVELGYEEYAKRLGGDVRLELVEVTPQKRTKNSDIDRLLEREGTDMLAKVDTRHRIVALDVKGRAWDTSQLAQSLEKWQHDGRHVDLLVGGPEGLARSCVEAAEQKWSLSPLTLPHPLVRVVVAEALFRAWSLLHNHPYHRE